MTTHIPPTWWLVTLMMGWAVMLGTAHLGAAAPGQTVTAAVRGVVRDPSGAVIPGAVVTLTALDTGLQRPSVASGSEGTFQIIALPPGNYRLDIENIENAAFAPEHRDLTLTVDQQLTLDITLALSRPSAAIDVVSAPASPIEPTRTSLGGTITAREIDSLPVPPVLFREFASLATLTPGILPAAGGGIVTAGQAGNSNQFLSDGAVLQSGTPPPLDAVREFKTVSNHFSAEFGQASGAVVSVVTRSGTNAPAARVHWLQMDSAWNAQSPPARQAGVDEPGSRQESYGGYWGGPIVKDRLFLFATAEQVAQHSTYVNTSPVALLFRPDDPLTRPFTNTSPKAFARTDVNLSRANLLTGRYSFQRLASDNAVREALSTMERGATLRNPVHDAAVIDTHVLGATAVHEVRLHWNRNRFDRRADGFCPGCAALNYPSIRMGKGSITPQVTTNTRLDAADTITWLPGLFAGSHAFKAGIAVDALEGGGGRPQNADGTFLFQADIPFDPANASSYPTQFTQSVGRNDVTVSQTIVSAFGQDEWQPTAGLTLNLGVRWDHTEWPGPTGGRHDVAPRLGLAFDPWRRGTTVFRAGAGRYYDENTIQIARDAEIATMMVTIARPGFQGDPLRFDPLGLNPNRVGPAVPLRSINQHTVLQTPYTDQASVGMQHQLGRTLALSADLVRATGHRLPVGRDLNYPDPVTHLRPSPDTSLRQIIVTETIGHSWYTGLQVGLQQRSTRYSYSVAYTWSSSENDTDGNRAFPQDQNNLLADRGPSPNDARHSATAGGTVPLPLGLQLATLVTAYSALPYNVTTGRDSNSDGVPTNDRPAGVGRNSARGSAFFQADVRLSKFIGWGPRRLELQLEAFNLTNRSNWTSYNGNQSSASNYGVPAAAGPPRQIQIGVRFGTGGTR